MTAEQIVEAEIGPKIDVDAFVKDALPVDFLLNRFALNTDHPSDPIVYDIKTDIILCYLSHVVSQEHSWWFFSALQTIQHMRNVLNRDPGFSSAEATELVNSRFQTWREAVRFLLGLKAVQAFVKETMGIQEARKEHLYALGYESTLDALRRSLVELDILVEKIDRRAGKGTSCYLLAKSDLLDSAEVEGLLKAAAIENRLFVDNVKAALRTEAGQWQIDFNISNLFEAIDPDEFVWTAFRNEVPGYAELERARAYRDALRQRGMNVHTLSVHTFNNFTTGVPQVEYIAYWDNRLTNYGKQKAVDIALDAAASVGIPVDSDQANCFGHGNRRYITLFSVAIGKPRYGPLIVDVKESEEDPLAEFGEIAAAKTGTVGDELRLKRLVNYLRDRGLKVGSAFMQQSPSVDRDKWVVSYHVSEIRDLKGVLSSNDAVARAQLQSIVLSFTRQDMGVTGAEKVPVQYIHAIGTHVVWSGFTVQFSIASLRFDNHFLKADKVRLKLESMSDYELFQFTKDAIPGLRTRLWLKDLRECLESKGFVVRAIHAKQYDYKLRIKVHINAASSSTGTDYKVFTANDVIREYYASVNEVHGAIINDYGQYTHIVADSDKDPLVFTITGFVKQREGGNLEAGTELDESLVSDMGIGEHERLASIISHIENFHKTDMGYIQTHVLWAKAEPCDPSLGWPEGSTMVTVRLMRYVSSNWGMKRELWAALKNAGIKPVTIVDERGEEVDGIGCFKDIDDRVHSGAMISDYFIVLEPADDAPIQGPIVVRGHHPMTPDDMARVNNDDPEHIEEELDPDTEGWVRHVVEQTPGYKDMERFKAAMRELESIGYEVTGATQGPSYGDYMPLADRTDNMCSVLVSFKRRPSDYGAHGVAEDVDKIHNALKERWGINKISWHWDTTDKLHRVIEWQWRSHDDPKDMVPIHMRFGEWREYMACGIAHLEMDTLFLVEQSGEERDDFHYELFSAAQDVADPLWRERLRLIAIANDIKAAGYGGMVYIGLGTATMWASGWNIYFTITRPDNNQEMMDDYQVKGMIKNVIVKHNITNLTAWAYLHNLRPIEWEGKIAKVVHMPYMFGPDTSEEVRLGTPASKAHVLVNVEETIQFTPSELSVFGRIAARPSREQVIRQAWVAFCKALAELGEGHATQTSVVMSGRRTKIEFYGRVQLPEPMAAGAIVNTGETPLMLEFEKKLRAAVLKAGLSRYYPKRVLYHQWPITHVTGDRDDDSLDVSMTFTINNLEMRDVHIHVPNVRAVTEAWKPEDIGDLVDKADSTSHYGICNDLVYIAKELANDGWIGFVSATRQSTGHGSNQSWCNIVIRVAVPKGGEWPHNFAGIEKRMDEITSKFPRDHFVVDYEDRVLFNYEKEVACKGQWLCEVGLMLGGMFGDMSYVAADIKTQAVYITWKFHMRR